MKKSKYTVFFEIGLLAMVGLVGCNQETPIEKTKAAAASGNATTQAAGQAAVDAIKTPMDKARQVEVYWRSRLSTGPRRSRNRRSSRGRCA